LTNPISIAFRLATLQGSLAALFLFLAIGQFNPVTAQERQLSEDAQISLITIYPGVAPEELFGHSAIRVRDPRQDIDLSFNYGTFEFDSFFLPKFIYGQLDYFLSVARFSHAVRQYHQRRRPMIEQVLNLTAVQRQDLFDFLLVNAREENRYYRYDFLFDNCSTRIRDAMVSVLGDDILFAPQPDPGLTFRQLIDLYVDHQPLYDFGIDLLLGSKIDRVAEPWETMFLPDYLMEAFDHATVKTGGEMQPLVANTEKILQIDNYETPEAGVPWAAVLTWSFFLIGAIATYINFRNKQSIQRWLDIPLFLFAGITGILITFLWFISLHDVTANNLNLLWALPTHLILLPILYRRSAPGQRTGLYLAASALLCLIIAIGWFAWPQALHPAVLPLLLLLFLRSGWIALSQRLTFN
jgi:hypothetical protein